MAKKTDDVVEQKADEPKSQVHGTTGDSDARQSLALFIVPRGKDVKPDWILAASELDARRGADLFFSKSAIVAGPKEERPVIGARVLVQVQKRESQPDHLGFIFEEWSREHFLKLLLMSN